MHIHLCSSLSLRLNLSPCWTETINTSILNLSSLPGLCQTPPILPLISVSHNPTYCWLKWAECTQKMLLEIASIMQMLYHHYFFFLNCCLSVMTSLVMLHTGDANYKEKETKRHGLQVGKGRFSITSALETLLASSLKVWRDCCEYGSSRRWMIYSTMGKELSGWCSITSKLLFTDQRSSSERYSLSSPTSTCVWQASLSGPWWRLSSCWRNEQCPNRN